MKIGYAGRGDQKFAVAHASMLLRAAILGLSFTAVASMSEGLSFLWLTVARFGLAALALLPFVWRAPDVFPDLRGWALYGLLGLCQAFFFWSMFWAAHRATALEMAVLYVSVPFLVFCVGLAFGVEPPGLRLPGILVLGAIGALGLAWVEGRKEVGGIGFGLGEVVFGLGCIGLAIHSVLNRWGLSKGWLSSSAAVRAFWSLAIGAALVGALGLQVESPRSLAGLGQRDIFLLSYLGVVSTGGTFWLMQWAAPVLTPATANAYAYVPPLFATLVLLIADPQRLSWQWLPGAALVCLALVLLLRHVAPASGQTAR